MKVFNTIIKKPEELKPKNKNEILMYVCGLTPYDYFHLGHARTYVAFDVIKRYLKYKGYKVMYVQNITDIDDKIIKRAREVKKDPLELANHFFNLALEDMDSLGIERANIYPRVSEHINEIIQITQKLVDNGFAYESDGSVYYSVFKFKNYGKLSGQSLDEIKSGARVEIDESKQNPADFALWKKAKKGEISFKSPWGNGRPGWHIECTAMSTKYLGNSFDIHGGARDLIFPHHENEIAQTEAATGEIPFVRYWLHTGFLTVSGEKMSKSLGNLITVRDILKKYGPESLRLFYIFTHYRSPIDFSEDVLKQATNSLESLRNVADYCKVEISRGKSSPLSNDENELIEEVELEKKKFLEAMDNDFDTPNAITHLFSISHRINSYLTGNVNAEVVKKSYSIFHELCSIFGLLEEKEGTIDINFLIKLIVEIREDARKQKNFALSDKIRSELQKLGVILEDSDKGIVWKIRKVS